MIYKSRTSFAAIIRRARAEGTLTSYEKSRTLFRHATINWIWHIYEPAHWSVVDDRDEAYERASARDRNDDFSRTGGKDWT